MNNYDIIIVGAGPGGSFLAYKLAKKGLRTLVLEKNKEVKRKVCGEYLCPLGVELLKNEELEDQIVGSFLPLRGMLIVTSKNTQVDTIFPYQGQYHGVSVDRKVFDTNLMQLARTVGAEIKSGVEVKKISSNLNKWTVETTDGTFNAQVLVGADGRGSIVSKTFNNDIPNQSKRVALHAFVDSKQENIRRGEMHLFSNGAYIGINPTGDREINFSLVVDAEEIKQLGSAENTLNYYIQKSENLSQRFKNFDSTTKISTTFPIQHKTKSILPRRNVALIGDAAGFVDPLTGEGMYNALLSAKLLAEAIIKDLDSNFLISKQAFIHYQNSYSMVLNQKILLNRFFQSLIKKPRLVEQIARYLLKKQSRANIFIGIIGNIYSPVQGILKLMLNFRGA